MTLDQLFVEAGEHLDELIDARRATSDVMPVSQRRRHWSGVRFAAAALAVAGLLALVMVVGRHDATPSSPPDTTTPSPTDTLAHIGPVSVFDTGADLAVFIKPGVAQAQLDLIQSETARVVSEIGTLVRVEYLTPELAMTEARRVQGRDSPASAAIRLESTPTLLWMWVSLKTGATLSAVQQTLMQLPNVLTVWTKDTGAVGQYPLCCYNDGGAIPQTTLAPLATDPADSTPVNDANRGQVDLLLTGLTQLAFANSEYSTTHDGVTTITAWNADQTQNVAITITPGDPVIPESHIRPLIGVLEQTPDLLRMKYDSNSGWKLVLVVERTSAAPLPSLADVENLIYGSDP
jgi:hypothetical protein